MSPRDDEAVSARLAEFARTRDQELRTQLVEDYWWIVGYAARRYGGRGEPVDDLMQIAALGLVKALDRYDPASGTSFASFAIPTAIGEVRRHFRDATWRVRVPRRLKDLVVQIGGTIDALTQDLGRPPTHDEIADRIGVGADDVRDALAAGAANRTVHPGPPGSADAGVGELAALAGDDEETSDARMLVHDGLAVLPERSRRIVYLRFFLGLSQSEIAERTGISQPHVSRLLNAALVQLREHLTSGTPLAEAIAERRS
ncbi:MAG TPA: sigma-70 family RNA polymerase sigma factor [Acidimicrobiales bacterium]|nr:sigma-70 family RNA polymerase sigma factor [Acidimicrobiales bacterium]